MSIVRSRGQYPSTWQAIGAAGHAKWVSHAYSNGDETLCRWEGEGLYRVKGIVRTRTQIDAGIIIMHMPDGYVSSTVNSQYIGMPTSASKTPFFLELRANTKDVYLQFSNFTIDGWIMFDATFILKKA